MKHRETIEYREHSFVARERERDFVFRIVFCASPSKISTLDFKTARRVITSLDVASRGGLNLSYCRTVLQCPYVSGVERSGRGLSRRALATFSLRLCSRRVLSCVDISSDIYVPRFSIFFYFSFTLPLSPLRSFLSPPSRVIVLLNISSAITVSRRGPAHSSHVSPIISLAL